MHADLPRAFRTHFSDAWNNYRESLCIRLSLSLEESAIDECSPSFLFFLLPGECPGIPVRSRDGRVPDDGKP